MVSSLLAVTFISGLALFWLLNPPPASRWADFPKSDDLELLSIKGLNLLRLYRMFHERGLANRFMRRQALDVAQHFWQVDSVMQAHPRLRPYYRELLQQRRTQLEAEMDLWLTQGMAVSDPTKRVPPKGWYADAQLAQPSLLEYGTTTSTVAMGVLLLGATVAFVSRGYDLAKLEKLFSEEATARTFLENAALEEARQYQLQQLLFSYHPDLRYDYLNALNTEINRIRRMVELLYPPAPKGAVILWWESIDAELRGLMFTFFLLSVAALAYFLLDRWLSIFEKWVQLRWNKLTARRGASTAVVKTTAETAEKTAGDSPEIQVKTPLPPTPQKPLTKN